LIKDILFPRRCPICDSILEKDKMICDECIPIPRRVRGARCLKCSKHIDDAKEELCFDCKKNEKNFKRGVALYEYDSVKDSLNRFKNASRPEYAAFYASNIAKHLKKEIKGFEGALLVPIPLHISKLKKRGYNQSELLAKELSERLDIPYRNDILERVKKTKEQKKQSAEQRQKNMVGAFHIRQNGVKLKSIILVDDVYTTGSTINEAAGVLLEGGAENVCFVTVAVGIDN